MANSIFWEGVRGAVVNMALEIYFIKTNQYINKGNFDSIIFNFAVYSAGRWR